MDILLAMANARAWFAEPEYKEVQTLLLIGYKNQLSMLLEPDKN